MIDYDTLYDWALRSVQELQEFADEARKSGSPLPGVEELIQEFSEMEKNSSENS